MMENKLVLIENELVFCHDIHFFNSEDARKFYTEKALTTLLYGQDFLIAYEGEAERKVTIYNYNLSYLLYWLYFNQEYQSSTEYRRDFINGFWNPYIKGFESGLVKFEAEYSLPKEVVYGPNANRYSEDLHRHFIGKLTAPFDSGGWSKWAFSISMGRHGFHSTSLEEYGYYAGLMKAALDTQNRFPSIFKEYELCLLDKAQRHLFMDKEMKKTYEHLNQFGRHYPKSANQKDPLLSFLSERMGLTSKTTHQNLQNLISQGKLEEAIKEALARAEQLGNKDTLLNDITILLSRYNKNEESRNIITLEDYNLEYRRIAHSLLDCLKQLDDPTNP